MRTLIRFHEGLISKIVYETKYKSGIKACTVFVSMWYMKIGRDTN
jgi:hypothetical protein